MQKQTRATISLITTIAFLSGITLSLGALPAEGA
jgi:hypothetical protein